MDVSPPSAVAGSTGNTWTFTYTASATIVSGELTIAVPAGFSVPSASASAPGFNAEERLSSTGTLSALASGSPLVLVTAADGSGTMQVSPASTVTGATGTT
jgi:hypothetical protein